ncbi:2-hydroxycarboxylate transporter family protein [Entomospira culicis]|uniref:2-hydroxycarboxylate transporter family protein n=1 Tax=Entomospira culicis TaxID=2719989 RepID=A0A968GF42_9SPIO|nr:2-hydroxycarboxylate transporter family protein [Entomospira culicis]NIZ19170.1 2-hydroxycarboxylate transporter family protein [Entomospira culicis]NIZ69384.1 2-hydroxycarboxylate transporter family protein [Entomospira culicis]WDI36501.1 2-hydroxycarboxylate transporter family protein [Entomospira culicis]WDI38127.1 2-hydroxycarboxylate transporter family protein [Entomospira culicis]
MEKKPFSIYGMPAPYFLVIAAIVLGSAYSGILPMGLIGGTAFLLVVGIILGEIGERIPIWNTWIGGGAVLAFLGSAILLYYNLMPAGSKEIAEHYLDEVDFLNFFIAVLITGSILAVNRSILLKAIAGYIPTILLGLVGAVILGSLIGMLFGFSPSEIVAQYVLPIMGGGNGAGAIPLSQIYAEIQGDKAIKAGTILANSPELLSFTQAKQSEYYSQAIAILTIANIFAIIFGALLHQVGNKFPSLTGNGELLKSNQTETASTKKDEKSIPTLAQLGAGLLLALSFYILGLLFSRKILPDIMGFKIHNLAYTVLFVALANGFGLINVELRNATKRLQDFVSGRFLLLLMVAVGLADTDIGHLLSVLNVGTLVISLFVVTGAVLGAGLGGMIFKFYFVESAISAGLCMANRGGSGDLAVLGAAKRMSLMSFAQISSRLGGGIVLILASIFMNLQS